MEEIDFIKARIKDKSNEAYKKGEITSTNFYSFSKVILIENLINEYPSLINPNVDHQFMSLNEESEYKLLVFYNDFNENELNDYLSKRISLLLIEFKNKKFKENLTHRDYLGALMNLGIEREFLGDILIKEEGAYVYVLNEILEIILNDLTKVKHTDVIVKKVDNNQINLSYEFEEKMINVSSNRLDSIIGEIYGLSRADSKDLIMKDLVKISSKNHINPSTELKNNDRVSVYKKGKFIFLKEDGFSKKGRMYIKVKIYK